MLMFIRSLGLAVSLLLCFYSQFSASDQSVTDSLSCPNAELFSGKLFTDVCWACLFPIRIAGVSITPGDAPSGASTKSICMCEDNLGLWKPGIVNSLWEPARLIEVVRKPGCSLALGGITLPIGDKRLWGTLSDAE